MKKIFAFFLALMLLFSVASAEMAVSAMTDEDLYNLLNAARNELASRLAHVAEKTFIIDNDEITIYCTGGGSVNFMDEFLLEVVFINNSTDKEIGVGFKHIVINGWEVDSFEQLTPIKPGRKTKETIALSYKGADLSSYQEIEEIGLTLYTFDGGNYHTITEYDEVLLNFDGSSWS